MYDEHFNFIILYIVGMYKILLKDSIIAFLMQE